jgi:transposase
MNSAPNPHAVTRTSALFAGPDGEAKYWAVIASVIEACKLNDTDRHAYLAGVSTPIVNVHSHRRLDERLPWIYPASLQLRSAA